MARWLLTLGLVVALGGVARGDELAIASRPIKKGKPLKKRVEDNVDDIADQFGLQVSRLSYDILQMHFDVKKKRAELKLDAGDTNTLGFTFDSDVKFHGNFARVDATVDLALGGRVFKLDLPEVDVGHSKFAGEHGVEVRLPLLHGKF